MEQLCNLFTEAEVSQAVKCIGCSEPVSKLSSHVERTLETFQKLGDRIITVSGRRRLLLAYANSICG